VATATTAEITPRNITFSGFSHLPRSLFFFLSALLGPLLHTNSRMTTSLRSFPPLHRVCYFACDFYSKRSPTLSHHLFSPEPSLIPLLTTRYKVLSLSIPGSLSFYSNELWPVSLRYHSSLPTYVYDCHLDLSSTFALPEPFPLRLLPPFWHTLGR